jgi:hypothetical protein
VQNLLSQMQSRFQQMSDSIITRIDEMGERIDDLEKSVVGLHFSPRYFCSQNTS